MSVSHTILPVRRRNDESRKTSASAAANLNTMSGTATTQEDGSLMETATTRENSQTAATINPAATTPLPMKLVPEKKKLIPEKLVPEKALKREYSQPISLRTLPPTSPPTPRPLLPPPATPNPNSNTTPTQNHPCTLPRKEVTRRTCQKVIQMETIAFLNQGPAQI